MYEYGAYLCECARVCGVSVFESVSMNNGMFVFLPVCLADYSNDNDVWKVHKLLIPQQTFRIIHLPS